MMRRATKRRVQTRWLEEYRNHSLGGHTTPFGPMGGYTQVTLGTTGTLQFPVLQLNSSQTFDPATLEAGGTVQFNPRTQLVNQPGWRMMRLVGEFNVALAQVASEANTDAKAVQCEAGLFLGEIDEEGALQNGADWHLPIPVQIPDDDASRSVQMEGEARPWVWRRSWLLGNQAALNTAHNAIPGDDVQGGNPFQFVDDTDGYNYGPSANWKLPFLLGPHFDIKRHVTLKRNQALFWAFGATGWNATTASEKLFRLCVMLNWRMLIAKPGRAWRDERR